MDEQGAGGRPGEGRERPRSLRRWIDLPLPPRPERRLEMREVTPETGKGVGICLLEQHRPAAHPCLDGVGELNVKRAVELAREENLVSSAGKDPWVLANLPPRPRGYYLDMLSNWQNFYAFAYMTTAKKARARVVVAFDAVVPCMSSEDKSCGQAELAADLDLRVDRLAPGPPYVTSSVSWDSSFEVVEFDPEPGVQYRISVYAFYGVKKQSCLAVAWETWDVP